MIEDRTGQSREVDILIETSSGDHPIRIGVECRDHGQKCDVTWIEQLEGKYRDLPIDKVIAVSKSGFTKGAFKKAAAFGIRSLDFGQAEVEDWVIQLNPVRGLCITTPHLEVRHANYEIAGSAPPDLPKRLKRAKMRCPRFKYPVTLNQVLDFIALSPEGRTQLEALQAKQPGQPLGGEVNLDAKSWTLIDRRRQYNLTRIQVTALVTTEKSMSHFQRATTARHLSSTATPTVLGSATQ